MERVITKVEAVRQELVTEIMLSPREVANPRLVPPSVNFTQSFFELIFPDKCWPWRAPNTYERAARPPIEPDSEVDVRPLGKRMRVCELTCIAPDTKPASTNEIHRDLIFTAITSLLISTRRDITLKNACRTRDSRYFVAVRAVARCFSCLYESLRASPRAA